MKIYQLEHIITPRLIIRPVELGDEFGLNKAINRSLVPLQKWQLWAQDPSIDATRGFVQRGVFAWQSASIADFPMVVIHKKDQKIIAASGYNDRSNPLQALYEIGYWIDIDYQGQGLVTEYTNALTRFALSELMAAKVIISMQINNSKSIAVAQRLNFINAGTKDRDPLDCITDWGEKNYIYCCTSLKNLPPVEVSWLSKQKNNNDKAVISWAKKIVGIKDDKVLGQSKVLIKTPWSNVIEINTGAEPVYLKQTPAALFIEVAVIKLLRTKCKLLTIPDIIADNPNLDCFLMKKCVDMTLRCYYNGALQQAILIQAISTYRALQRATVPYVDEFISLAVPDWRLDKFAKLYTQLIADSEFLANNGLNEEQQQLLHQYQKTVTKLCKQLASYRIPECLNHSDFHDNNILYDRESQMSCIIDLGETAINHPFFSLAALLCDTKKRYDLDDASDTYQALKKSCYSGWMITNSDLQQAIKIVEHLLPLYLLLAQMRFARACSAVELKKIARMNNRIRNAFIWFMENISTRE